MKEELIAKARKARSGDLTGLLETRSLYEKYQK